jgi:hypothetical protein
MLGKSIKIGHYLNKGPYEVKLNIVLVLAMPSLEGLISHKN